MFRSTVLLAAAAFVGGTLMAVATPAEAGGRYYREGAVVGQHAKSKYYRHRRSAKRRGTRVYGWRNGGGYSYNYFDIINTYGDTRNKYGGSGSFRGPDYERQSSGGPFDSGFFFDSGMGPRGGDSPYIN